MLATQDICDIEVPAEDTRTDGERLIAKANLISMIQLSFAREAAAFAATDQYTEDGAATSIDWIRIHCH